MTQSLRVGYDLRPALLGRAGIARYARDLAQALLLLEDGPHIEAYGYARLPIVEPFTPANPDRFHLNRGLLPARLLRFLHRLPFLDAGRFPSRVDLFHWTDFVYPEARSVPTVLTLHDAAFLRNPAFHGENAAVLAERVGAAIPRATMIHAVSEAAREDALSLGADPDCVRVIPHGVDDRFQPAGVPSPFPAPYLLSVGTVEPRKNHLRTLRALESLWDHDGAPHWTIVGRRGWECEEFERALEDSPHTERVHWLKSADDERLLPLLQHAEGLLYPSLYEGFGLPVVEAMACGTPSLVGAGTVPAELAGDAAIAVDAESVEAIASGITTLLRSEEARERMMLVGCQRAASHRWDQTAEATLALYHEAQARFAASGSRP